MIVEKSKIVLKAHWFLPVAMLVVGGDLVLALADSWSDPALLEAGLLFDLAIVLPALYWWCYRKRGRAALLKAAALSCLGIWVAGHIVPDQHHELISTVGFARYVGLAVLLVIELKLVVAIYRAAFSSSGANPPLSAAQDAGMPEWAARLMAWEASLLRRGWELVRRLVRLR
ncbi:hypothetical protein [Pseudofulvimonas gallinarii]|jgi:hypothetical protein|uniref:Uncharacterized protein n=1 Tax=Pseudofulvimonas gallinarii TaxID=634155 RepID=A0A4R3LK52_9GAMM|nr:hypothetical protein [Pseudofulvimonas gallinarii]TCT00670.1 hypothetical protein EDC25_10234 [Pseudofulvimonas gallinarii]THD12031.1 hypothetical protein B1808_13925 [Pseudofulvimonas gallinarii]